MMNPNAYGPPQQQQQQPQQFPPQQWPQQAQQPQQLSGTATGGQGMMPPPTATSLTQSMPPSSQGMQNGNYQQQLATSMSGLSMNPLKQQMPPLPPTSFASSNPTNMAPPTAPSAGMQPPPTLSNGQAPQTQPVPANNNNYGYAPNTNGPLPPPTAAKSPAPGSMYAPTSVAAVPQSVPSGINQMTINSASVPGLPHMPPQKSSVPPMTNQPVAPGAPMPTTSTGIMPPQSSQQQLSGQTQQMSPRPQQTSGIQHQQAQQQQQPSPQMPPISNAAQPPMQTSLNSNPMQSKTAPDMPPMPGYSQQPGFPPQTQQPGFPPQSQQSAFQPKPQQPGFQPQSQQPGVPPQPQQPQSQQPGFPPHPQQPQSQQPGFPPPPQQPQSQQPGFPPQPQQPGFAPQSQHPGFPPPPQQSGYQIQPQQPGFPPQSQQLGFPPQPQKSALSSHSQQSGFPPQPQQPGFPPQAQQPGFPPQPQKQQPGFPLQPQPIGFQQAQQPGFPPNLKPSSYPAQPQQVSYPPQPMHNQMMPPSAQPVQQMPQRPGYNQPPMSGGMYQQPQQYQQPQRRLDPDQMPNPIQVMIENQRNAGGAFVTNQAGLLPPLVTTKFVVQDQGNSSPRYIRSSLYCIPSTGDILKNTACPFTLLVSPLARLAKGEYEPPIVDFGELGPIRCNRCKAYMSPNMQFIDAGRRFQCLMCKVTTEVPTEYFQHLDHTGQRVDKYERPELVLGTYEFVATKDYCRNNTSPEIPAFVFVIDVSYNTIKSGLVHLLCSQIKTILKHLPVDQGQDKSKVRVGFITYNSTVHFYNIKNTLAQPQMMIVGDVQDMFMPLLDGFLCHPEESEALIDALMEEIPKMFVETKETETILYPAIQAGLEALKAANCTGKLLVFNSSLPIAEAPGKLKNRDDRKLLGTEKEKTVLTPQCNSYNTLGQDCVQNGCSVDLFIFNNSYIDIATIGQVSRLTGGEVFKYTYFQADSDGKRLIEDIIKNISRPIAFDAVMRVRTSTGIRATDFYGHYFMSNTTDVELASVDSTKAIAIEIKHDDKLPPEENVYVQIALLYTSCSGQRRLRIFNLALTATVTIAEVFKSCDLDAMVLFFAKQACFKLMELTPKAVKDNLIHRTAQILACYRKHCTSPTSAGQLILPECLKLLPLYVSCLLKNDAISGGSDMTLDDRSYVIQFLLSMDLNMSVNYFYPRFIPIHDIEPEDSEIPMAIRCTHEKMSENGAYILENGVYLFVWLGQSLPQTFIQPLFGVQCTQQVNSERFAITGDTPLARRVTNIIETIMEERTRYMRITCVKQSDKLESVFRHFLIEDRGTDGSSSYVDFLCHMHKEIKDLLS